jgi:hypothetical protein
MPVFDFVSRLGSLSDQGEWPFVSGGAAFRTVGNCSSERRVGRIVLPKGAGVKENRACVPETGQPSVEIPLLLVVHRGAGNLFACRIASVV